MVISAYFVYFLLPFLGARRLAPNFGAVSGVFQRRFGAWRPQSVLLLHYGV
jgi:hypothetical protein